MQFLLYTGWGLKHVGNTEPMPADLGYHAYEHQYDGQPAMVKCLYLDGKSCYYDGSALNAEPVFYGFVEHGEEWLWERLKDYYESVFCEHKKED